MPEASVRGIFFKQRQEYSISEPMKHLFGMFPSSCYTLYSNTLRSITVTQPFDPSKQQLKAEVVIHLVVHSTYKI